MPPAKSSLAPRVKVADLRLGDPIPPGFKLRINAYARYRGCAGSTVRRAIKSERISIDSDGRLDVAKCDAAWAESPGQQFVDPKIKEKQAMKRGENGYPVDDEEPESPDGSSVSERPDPDVTYTEAKRRVELLKAKRHEIEIRKAEFELVDRSAVYEDIVKIARQFRDHWLAWPNRIAATLAAELKEDQDKIRRILQKAVRTHLEQLSDVDFNKVGVRETARQRHFSERVE